MFEELALLPPDSILGLAAKAAADPNPDKVDLTVGIYMDEQGHCPVFEAVRQAQAQLVARETSKAYLPPVGIADFNTGIQRLLLGPDNAALAEGRVGSVQTPGGCGAVRLAAELIYAAAPSATVWVSDPTWPVHLPLLGRVGLKIESYRYYDAASHGVDFEGMLSDLKRAKSGDVVLLHGCCHNPCGADLSLEQWRQIAALASERGLLPLVDIAYQGLGDGLQADADGLRLLVEQLPEVLIAASCSKNMGLYRERTGAVAFTCRSADNAAAMISQALVAARSVYSMPPAHGAIIAGMLFSDAQLNALWQRELVSMCERINGLRSTLVEKLSAASDRDFSFIEREKGMFSFLGLTPQQAQQLRAEHSVYLLDSSRINVAGVNARNIDYLARAVAQVL